MDNTTVVFDLDGTLIDSAPDVCHALNRTLQKIGRRDHSVDEVKGYLGHGATHLMLLALKSTGDIVSDAQLHELTDSFLREYAAHPVIDTVVFPGVEDCLNNLLAHGAKLSICTNKPSKTAAPVLEALKIEAYFDAIVCGDEVQAKKPSASHILETIAAVGGAPDRAIMVGDSENDILAAQAAGIPSVVVSFGYSVAPAWELGADVMIDSFSILFGVLSEISACRLLNGCSDANEFKEP